jgi:hypothetical protein
MSSTIASEKTTNYIFRPVLKTRPKKTFPYLLNAVDTKKDGQLELDRYWTAKHHMMLDVLANELLENFQKRTNDGQIFTTHLDEIIRNEAMGLSEEMLNYFANKTNHEKDRATFVARRKEMKGETIAFSDYDLYLKYEFLRHLPPSEIHKLLMEMASTMFRCSFRVKLLNHAQHDYAHSRYRMWFPEPLFSLDVTPVNQTKHNPPRIKARLYTITFGGVLGSVFAHNVKCLNIIRLPVDIYQLSQDAQFIYRRFVSTIVVPKGEEKSGKFKVECKDLEKYLDMKVEHRTYRLNRIERALKELKDGKFVEYESKQLRWNREVVFEMVRLR